MRVVSTLRTSLFVAAGAAALLLAQPSATRAALLVYDSFTTGAGPSDYVAGTEDPAITNPLGGQNPATGPTPFYAGGWIQPGADAQVVKNIGSLAYPLFPQAGGQVQETVQFGCCSFGRSGREIAGGLGGGRDPRTIYQSFLIDFGTQGTDDPTQFGKRAYEMWNGGVGDSFLAVDLFVNHFSGTNQLTLQVTTLSGTQSILVDGGLTLQELQGVHLVVLRFDFDPANPDRVTVYLDPTDSVEANYTPAATIDVANSDLVITHHGTISNFTFSGPGHIPGAFDELRWGDTFADVTPFLDPETPVPAPSTLAVFLVGMLGVLAGRRRRA